MRLRLSDRLRRLVGWRAGARAGGHSRTPDSRAREDAGRHRKNGAFPHQPAKPPEPHQPPQPPWPPQAPWPPGSAWPPAGAGPAWRPVVTGPARPPAGTPWVNGGSRPPEPRNYTPRAGVAGAGTGTGAGTGAGGGAGRARIREAPFGAAPVDSVAVGQEAPQAADARPAGTALPRQPWYQVVGEPATAWQDPSPAAFGAAWRASAGELRAARDSGLPFASPHPQGHPPAGDGRANCGALEAILWRQWDAGTIPPPQVIDAIERLAELPRQLQEKLAAALDGIYVGAGGVPELDDMSALRGVPLPSGRATWDACAGAYGERKIVVGSRPSPTPDVMCHEVGHALDDIDSPQGKWQSDSAEFRMIYDRCQPYLASDFHRQRGGLGRKEFFADSFAAIASAQRPALVDMLSGNTRMALAVMLYFNRRYGI